MIPKDPAMMLSYVNLKLRDYYPSLDRLCEEEGADREELCESLAKIDYRYDPAQNQFI